MRPPVLTTFISNVKNSEVFKLKSLIWSSALWLSWINKTALFFPEVLQAALRYNETSNIYLGNSGVELSLAENSLSWDKLTFNNKKSKKSSTFWIKQLVTIEHWKTTIHIYCYIVISLLFNSVSTKNVLMRLYALF